MTSLHLLLLGCLFLVASSSELLAVWQETFDTDSPFTVTQLNPKTAKSEGPVLYTNVTLQSLFGGTTVFDDKNKIWYLQNFPSNKFPLIIGLDLSNPTAIKVTKSITLPFEAFVIQLDTENEGLILAGGIPHLGGVDHLHRRHVGQVASVEVGVIDPTTQTYKTLTHLPDNHWFLTIAGSSSAFDSNSRLLVISMQNAIVNPVQYWIHTVDIDTGKVSSYQQKDYIVQSMVSLDNMIATLMTSQNDENGSLLFGLLDPKTGTVTLKAKWNEPSISFVVNGISVKDEPNGVIYSVVGNGVSPPAALATIDIASGALKEFHYFQTTGNLTQPQYIAIM